MAPRSCDVAAEERRKAAEPEQSPYVRLAWVRKRLGGDQPLTRGHIMRMVEAGDFPPALEVSPRVILFRRADVLAWEEGRWLRQGDREREAEEIRSAVRRDSPGPQTSARRRRRGVG